MGKNQKEESMLQKHRESLTAADLTKNGHEKLFHHADHASLEEINNTIPIPQQGTGRFKTLLGWMGPGALVAVGYIDPGNWVTSLTGGAQFQYTLLSVCLISGLIAMLLQSMAARMGIATGLDLAQATRAHINNKFWNIVLWIITELAIMATDIAEVIGSGIALMLLFHFPLIVGILITAFDVLLLLLLMMLGFRKIEAIVVALITVVLVVFVYEVVLSKPELGPLFAGYIPSPKIITHSGMLYVALGIVGATVMPHNLYLHSSIIQARQYDRNSVASKKNAIHFSNIDSNSQLSLAIVINSLLLILGAALFFGHSEAGGDFQAIYNSLQNSKIVGVIASPILSMLFAIALLASGQNSTITGTLSGQIVMEGFLHLRMPLWARRLLTRLLSLIPVLTFAIIYHGNQAKIEELMTFSQVFLSIALPFCVFPLTMYTSNVKFMGKEFVNPTWVKWSAYAISAILSVLNIWLIWSMF